MPTGRICDSIAGMDADLAALPDDVDTFAMMPIGWPLDAFGPLSRKPLVEVVHADRWGNAWRDTPR